MKIPLKLAKELLKLLKEDGKIDEGEMIRMLNDYKHSHKAEEGGEMIQQNKVSKEYVLKEFNWMWKAYLKGEYTQQQQINYVKC